MYSNEYQKLIIGAMEDLRAILADDNLQVDSETGERIESIIRDLEIIEEE